MRYIALRGFKLGPETPIVRPDGSGQRHLDEYMEFDIDDEQLKHKDVQFFINSRPQYIVESDSEAGKKKAEEGRKRKSEKEARKRKEEAPLLVEDVNHAVHRKTMRWTIIGVIVAIILGIAGLIVAWLK
jgi:hypothetical protein